MQRHTARAHAWRVQQLCECMRLLLLPLYLQRLQTSRSRSKYALIHAHPHRRRYAFNNPMAAFFCGTGYGDGPFGGTVEEQVSK